MIFAKNPVMKNISAPAPALDYQPESSHGWIALTVPRVFVHEAVRVDL
jgi:hypothetical protein